MLGFLHQAHSGVAQLIDADNLPGNLRARIVLLLHRRRGSITGIRYVVDVLHKFLQRAVGADGIFNRLPGMVTDHVVHALDDGSSSAVLTTSLRMRPWACPGGG